MNTWIARFYECPPEASRETAWPHACGNSPAILSHAQTPSDLNDTLMCMEDVGLTSWVLNILRFIGNDELFTCSNVWILMSGMMATRFSCFIESWHFINTEMCSLLHLCWLPINLEMKLCGCCFITAAIEYISLNYIHYNSKMYKYQKGVRLSWKKQTTTNKCGIIFLKKQSRRESACFLFFTWQPIVVGNIKIESQLSAAEYQLFAMPGLSPSKALASLWSMFCTCPWTDGLEEA